MKTFIKVCICIIVNFIFIGCKEQYIVESKISSADVRLVKDRLNNIHLMLPIGFNFKFNRDNINSVDFEIHIDKNKISGINIEDIIIYDEKSGKGKFNHTMNKEEFPKEGYILSRNFIYSRKNIEEILNRLDMDISKITSLNTPNDTLRLCSYIEFRKKNTELIEDLNKVPDSIRLRVRYDGTKIKILNAKINW